MSNLNISEIALKWLNSLKDQPNWPQVRTGLKQLEEDSSHDREKVMEILLSSWCSHIEQGLSDESLVGPVDDAPEDDKSALWNLEALAKILLDDYQKRLEEIKVHSMEENGETTVKEILTLCKSGANNDTTEFKLEFPRIEPRYFFGLCPINYTTGESLKACSGCNSVFYSNKEAQKVDWKRHKALCKALQPLVRQTPGVHPLHKAPEKTKTIIPYLEATLGRKLEQYEQDVLTYPKLCNVCLDGNQAMLRSCKKCHCAAYCSADHEKEDEDDHKKSCQFLETLLQDYVKARLEGHPIARKWKPRQKPICAHLPESMEAFFQPDLCLWRKVCPNIDDNLLGCELRQLSYDYNCQLTALYGAERAGQLAGGKGSIHAAETLVVHVVGARQAETLDLTRWELFHHQLPRLKSLTVVFIGPELRSCCPFTDFTSSSRHLRASKGISSSIRYLFVPKVYHDFADGKLEFKAGEDVRKPDLVLALNCGFIFYQGWDASLAAMIKYPDVPLIFTEYYEEDCRLDLQKLDSFIDDELEVVVQPSANPFCSLLPARIPTGFAFRKFKRRNVVMSNDFICVVRAQKA